MSGPAGRGWRQITSGRDPELTWITVDGARLLVHQDVAPLFTAFLNRLAAGGYSLDEVADDWGWADRPVRGGTSTSYHAFGLAVDINATANPMAAQLVTNLPSWADEVAEEYGLSWGGNWRSRKDPMHFQFDGTPADARRIGAGLPAGAPAPAAATAAGPRSPAPTGSGLVLRRGARGLRVEGVQRLLQAAGHSVGPAGPDGDYGQRTEQAVLSLQRARGLTPDGMVGPRTWASLRSGQVLRRGARGAHVWAVQERVGAGRDGAYGPATETAVRRAQGARGIAQDGVVGPTTWGVIW